MITSVVLLRSSLCWPWATSRARSPGTRSVTLITGSTGRRIRSGARVGGRTAPSLRADDTRSARSTRRAVDRQGCAHPHWSHQSPTLVRTSHSVCFGHDGSPPKGLVARTPTPADPSLGGAGSLRIARIRLYKTRSMYSQEADYD